LTPSCTKSFVGWGFASGSDPTGELICISGVYFKREGRKREGEGRKRGEDGREKRGRGSSSFALGRKKKSRRLWTSV